MTDHPQGAYLLSKMTNPIPPRRESSHLNDINIITHLPPALRFSSSASSPGEAEGDIHITSWRVCITVYTIGLPLRGLLTHSQT